ncbi:unnamed protein product [Pleuronectes platessa]|uniref:Uncharacterized protein n=1 Tax=Pleuronectes platessa TaxID=8262 RepID=A0A9N7TWA4_PLEPL|nr:unnamed protein product [Pleuronectes platessa]
MNQQRLSLHHPFPQWQNRLQSVWLRHSLSFLQSPAVDTDTSGVSQHVPLCLPLLPLPLNSYPSPFTTLKQLSNRAGTELCLLPSVPSIFCSSPLFLWFPLTDSNLAAELHTLQGVSAGQQPHHGDTRESRTAVFFFHFPPLANLQEYSAPFATGENTCPSHAEADESEATFRHRARIHLCGCRQEENDSGRPTGLFCSHTHPFVLLLRRHLVMPPLLIDTE